MLYTAFTPAAHEPGIIYLHFLTSTPIRHAYTAAGDCDAYVNVCSQRGLCKFCTVLYCYSTALVAGLGYKIGPLDLRDPYLLT